MTSLERVGAFRVWAERPFRRGAELHTTPMIDVIFILLIFFVMVSELRRSSLAVDLPELRDGATTLEDVRRHVLIEVSSDRRLALDGEILSSIDVLYEKLSSLGARAAVGLRGDGLQNGIEVRLHVDRDARYEDVVQVLSAVNRAGLSRVGFEVRQEKS